MTSDVTTLERTGGISHIAMARSWVKRAMAVVSDGPGVTLPVWFLSAVAGAAALGTVSFVVFLWGVSQSVTLNSSKLLEHDKRLETLESVRVDVAGLKADVSAIRDTTHETNAKVDLLMERQMGRGKP